MTGGDFIGIAYGVIALPVWWISVGVVAWNERLSYQEKPDGDCYFFGAFVSCFMAAVWPLTLTVWALKRYRGDWTRLFYVPHRERDRMNEELLRERERRIDQAERELHIGPYREPRP